jgi:hypothetical protein
VILEVSTTTASFTWGGFLMSPGFGGTAAVIAAGVAYLGVVRNVRAHREANRKQQWWERARWALDLTVSDDSSTRAVGFSVLDALARSEWAGEHEAEVIDAAVDAALESYFSQDLVEDGESPSSATDARPADWESEDDQNGDQP